MNIGKPRAGRVTTQSPEETKGNGAERPQHRSINAQTNGQPTIPLFDHPLFLISGSGRAVKQHQLYPKRLQPAAVSPVTLQPPPPPPLIWPQGSVSAS
ncbi:hypothetical protein SKAU_G00035320 [Synaphobranchus kaupii]|uniref:Uncharacterized protein n=1 Tax=Synaphobranchus kaupii TaxID=118154 RepID=A0A9Q1JGU6_SYNKA|nr:hypothetical protein SKAU_G00035320 [Synaphobranchus kaupii]